MTEADIEFTDRLSALWDGEQHWLEVGVLFPTEGATLVMDGWEELEEEEELSPFESPSRTPILRETRALKDDPRFPLARAEQAWGSLSVSLSAFAAIAGVEKEQYEHVWPGQGSVRNETQWSFKTEEYITERM